VPVNSLRAHLEQLGLASEQRDVAYELDVLMHEQLEKAARNKWTLVSQLRFLDQLDRAKLAHLKGDNYAVRMLI